MGAQSGIPSGVWRPGTQRARDRHTAARSMRLGRCHITSSPAHRHLTIRLNTPEEADFTTKHVKKI